MHFLWLSIEFLSFLTIEIEMAMMLEDGSFFILVVVEKYCWALLILINRSCWFGLIYCWHFVNFMSNIPAGCHSDETLNWRSLLLWVYAEASKRSHSWGKCVTFVDASSLSPHQSILGSSQNLHYRAALPKSIYLSIYLNKTCGHSLWTLLYTLCTLPLLMFTATVTHWQWMIHIPCLSIFCQNMVEKLNSFVQQIVSIYWPLNTMWCNKQTVGGYPHS